MSKQSGTGWLGESVSGQLASIRRPAERPERKGRGKETLRQLSRLVRLKQLVQARLVEVARVLRTPAPSLRVDHRGRTSIDARPLRLDLDWVEGLDAPSAPAEVCRPTLLRAALARALEPHLSRDWLSRLLPRPATSLLMHVADFLSGYVLAAFGATLATKLAFFREVACLPPDDHPTYQARLLAFEQGQLAFSPAA